MKASEALEVAKKAELKRALTHIKRAAFAGKTSVEVTFSINKITLDELLKLGYVVKAAANKKQTTNIDWS